MQENKKKIILVSSFRPRECGIAAFSKDLSESLKNYTNDFDVEVIPIDEPGGEDRKYDQSIKFRIRQNDKESYRAAAKYINSSDAVAVSLQHEYGLYGGVSGNYILSLLKNIKKPILTTLHSITKTPAESEKKALSSIAKFSSMLVVMADSAITTLDKIYNVSMNKVVIIPHGVQNVEFQDQKKAKDDCGLEDKWVISTFGLIGRGKGIEYAIESLPKIKKEFPNVLYLILGKTHPNIIAAEGEIYRDSLTKRIKELDLVDNVLFVNRYVSTEEYMNYLLATDIYLTPYTNSEQITSGTLAYAMSAGRVCVSTPYIYAKELLKEGRGILVPFHDSKVLAEIISKLFRSNGNKKKMEMKNYLYTRRMTWENVSKNYAELLRELTRKKEVYVTQI
jgi:glycosyltransferase involved in cell wall biosynthesis